jgi:hypothetical protein
MDLGRKEKLKMTGIYMSSCLLSLFVSGWLHMGGRGLQFDGWMWWDVAFSLALDCSD